MRLAPDWSKVQQLRRDAIYVIRNILLPTDFSECSTAAFEHASTFAVMYNAHLHVLHVVRDHPLVTMDSSTPEGEKNKSSNLHGPEGELRKLVQRILPHQSKVIEAVRYGQAYKEIVNYARSEDIDLIVIATHGRTGLTHMVMGSVAERIVRFSPVPVLTIKPPKLPDADVSNGERRPGVAEETIHEYTV